MMGRRGFLKAAVAAVAAATLGSTLVSTPAAFREYNYDLVVKGKPMHVDIRIAPIEWRTTDEGDPIGLTTMSFDMSGWSVGSNDRQTGNTTESDE